MKHFAWWWLGFFLLFFVFVRICHCKTLRTLVEIKVLEKDEQRRLVTDVIKHAADDQASAVEVSE